MVWTLSQTYFKSATSWIYLSWERTDLPFLQLQMSRELHFFLIICFNFWMPFFFFLHLYLSISVFLRTLISIHLSLYIWPDFSSCFSLLLSQWPWVSSPYASSSAFWCFLGHCLTQYSMLILNFRVFSRIFCHTSSLSFFFFTSTCSSVVPFLWKVQPWQRLLHVSLTLGWVTVYLASCWLVPFSEW